jgi:hypothetical protein
MVLLHRCKAWKEQHLALQKALNKHISAPLICSKF